MRLVVASALVLLAMAGCSDSRFVYPDGRPDLVMHVAGVDGCLAFDLSVDHRVAVYGSFVNFTHKVTNTCLEPWTFTGGCYPVKVAILNHGVPYDPMRHEGVQDGIAFIKRPAGDCGAVNDYTVAQGETVQNDGRSNQIDWDPGQGAVGISHTPVPPGFYDVYLLNYGKHDGPFSKTLVVEVMEGAYL